MVSKADIKLELINSVLPIKDGDILFQCNVDLDGSFEQVSTNKIYKLSPENSDFQFYDVYKKTKGNSAEGEEWSIGFNYFKDGESYYYQPFMWRNGQPKMGKLKDHNPHNYCTNGDAVKFDSSSYTSSTVKEGYKGKGAGYTCTVIPIVLDFNATGGSVAINNPLANPTPVIVKTSRLVNNTDDDGDYETSFDQGIAQSFKTGISTTLTFKQGLRIQWEKEISVGVFKGKWETEISLAFEQSKNKSSEKTISSSVAVSETVKVPIKANSSKYVSLIAYTDQNATADVVAELNVTGTLFGENLSGDELGRIIKNSDTLDVTTTAHSISYNLRGKITANVVTKTDISISDREPTNQNLPNLIAS